MKEMIAVQRPFFMEGGSPEPPFALYQWRVGRPALHVQFDESWAEWGGIDLYRWEVDYQAGNPFADIDPARFTSTMSINPHRIAFDSVTNTWAVSETHQNRLWFWRPNLLNSATKDLAQVVTVPVEPFTAAAMADFSAATDQVLSQVTVASNMPEGLKITGPGNDLLTRVEKTPDHDTWKIVIDYRGNYFEQTLTLQLAEPLVRAVPLTDDLVLVLYGERVRRQSPLPQIQITRVSAKVVNPANGTVNSMLLFTSPFDTISDGAITVMDRSETNSRLVVSLAHNRGIYDVEDTNYYYLDALLLDIDHATRDIVLETSVSGLVPGGDMPGELFPAMAWVNHPVQESPDNCVTYYLTGDPTVLPEEIPFPQQDVRREYYSQDVAVDASGGFAAAWRHHVSCFDGATWAFTTEISYRVFDWAEPQQPGETGWFNQRNGPELLMTEDMADYGDTGLDPTVSVALRDLDNIMIVWHDQGNFSDTTTKPDNTVIRGVTVIDGQQYGAFTIAGDPDLKADPARLLLAPRVVYYRGHYLVCWLEQGVFPLNRHWGVRAKLYTWYGEPVYFGDGPAPTDTIDTRTLASFTWEGELTALTLSATVDHGDLILAWPTGNTTTGLGTLLRTAIQSPGAFHLAYAPNSQLVVTSPHTDQVMVYDPATPSFDWDHGDIAHGHPPYPYIIEPYDPAHPGIDSALRKVLNLRPEVPDAAPAQVDVGYVQDPVGTGPFYNRAFIINSGIKPGSPPDNPDYYDSFAVVDVDGIASSVVVPERLIADGARPVSVAVKSDGVHAYFACHDDDRVRYVDTVTYVPNEIRDSQSGLAAVIENPVAVALGEVVGGGADYYAAIVRLVRYFPDLAFVGPATDSRQALIAALQDIVDGYDDEDAYAIKATMGLVLAARATAVNVVDTAFHENLVVVRLDRGILMLADMLPNRNAPRTTAEMIGMLIESIPVASFDSPADKARASANAHVLGTLLSLNNPAWDQALERLTEIEDIIRNNLNDARLGRMILDVIAECRTSIDHIKSLFVRAASITTTLSDTVSGLPLSAFSTPGARVSLLVHVGLLRNFLENERLQLSVNKADQVKGDIQAKVTDADARTNLLEMIDQIIDILAGIGQ